MNTLCCRCALLLGMLVNMAAQADVLDQPVSLKTEGDLIHAVSATLQHAVATSERYRGTEPRLQRFARKEIKTRRKPIDELNKWVRIQPAPERQLAVGPQDDASYVRAILRNHARLLELIEFGRGLQLSANTKRLIDSLARDAATEMTTLGRLEKS